MAVTLDLDASIERITGKLERTATGLQGLTDNYERVGAASKAAIQGAAQDQDKLADATGKTGKKLKDQRGIIEKLEDHLKRLEKGQRKAQDVKTIQKYNAEIAKTRAALQKLTGASAKGFGAVSAGANASKGAVAGLGASLATAFAPLFAVTAAVAGIQQVVTLVTEYEQVAADLSAITGANGETLDFLKQSAVEVGTETTVSAAKTLEAYKLIASAKPELLSNAEGLANITREAVQLTEAFGGDLPTVALNLTDIMNKYGAEADRANEFTNALAAGSKEGSADVGNLAASFLVAGTELKSSNVRFQEGVGLFEKLAEEGLKGSEAGTGLRNVLSKLSATDVLPKDAVNRLKAAGVDMDLLSDTSLSFTDRLRALKPVQQDANALTALFGLENKSAAQILLNGVDRVDELTEAVTNTNVAQEQATIRTATASAEFQKLGNTIQSVIQGNTDGFGPLLALVIRFVREGILFLNDVLQELRPTFSGVIDAVGSLFSALGELLPEQENAAEGASFWTTAVQYLTVPLKILFFLIGTGIGVITNLVKSFSGLISQNTLLSGFFNTIKNGVLGFINVIIDLPAYLAGGFAAVSTFVSETKNSIFDLGSNIANVIKETFSFGKLIREGTADLKKALAEAIKNPFAGVGSKAAKAFTDEFNAAKGILEVPVVTANGSSNSPTSSPNPQPDAPSGSGNPSFNEIEAAKKRAEEQKKLEEEKQRLILASMQDGVEKQLALEEARFSDLKSKLEEFGLSTEEATRQNELNKLAIRTKFLQDAADLEGLSGEERINFLYNQTKAEIDALESALKEANGGQLLDSQVKQINLLRKKASEEYLATLRDFQDKEAQEAQDHEIKLLELKRGNFDSQKDFETFKQEEILKIRLKGAEAQLAIIEKLKGSEDSAALALRETINKVKGDLEAITKNGGAAEGFSLYGLFGLDPNDPENAKVIEGIETAAATAIDVISQVNAMRLETAEAAIASSEKEIEAIDKKIDAKNTELDEEEALREKGFANNAAGIEQDILLLQKQKAEEKKEQEKALKEKQKIQKQQAIIDTITQGSSLITAAAQVFQSVASIPFVGPVLGAALVAAMIGSFIAARAKVFQNISANKAEKGMFGVVEGKRHYQGGEAFGDHIEVERGEAFGVLSRKATRNFGKPYEAFVKAANAGRPDKMAKIINMFSSTAKLDKNLAVQLEDRETEATIVKANFTVNTENRELKENNKLLRKLLEKKAEEKETSFSGNKKIIKKGRTTRIVKNASNG